MNRKQFHPRTRASSILWLSDLHLDRATDDEVAFLADDLAGIVYDTVVITGDISSPPDLPRHLAMILAASKRKVCIVLGNHDYYGQTAQCVRDSVSSVCHRNPTLRHLGRGDIIQLNTHTALIGHDGSADGRAGKLPDVAYSTRGRKRLQKMRSLGHESVASIRATLPLALSRYDHVVIATHVPPFPSATLFDGKRCFASEMPYFSNLSLGLMLIGIARNFPGKRITVLAGHTHCAAHKWILPNLEIRVAGGKPGTIMFQEVIELGR